MLSVGMSSYYVSMKGPFGMKSIAAWQLLTSIGSIGGLGQRVPKVVWRVFLKIQNIRL